jgi:hypothetical protein
MFLDARKETGDIFVHFIDLLLNQDRTRCNN